MLADVFYLLSLSSLIAMIVMVERQSRYVLVDQIVPASTKIKISILPVSGLIFFIGSVLV